MTLRFVPFVPGDSKNRLTRGAGSGADALILDLEDPVVPARKVLARAMVAAYRGTAGPQHAVRFNPLDVGGVADLTGIVRPGLARASTARRQTRRGRRLIAWPDRGDGCRPGHLAQQLLYKPPCLHDGGDARALSFQ